MVAKRRTVWLSDEDWDRLSRKAADNGKNVSKLVREIAQPVWIAHHASLETDETIAEMQIGTDAQQAMARERIAAATPDMQVVDDPAWSMMRAGFGQPRPAPKPKGK